MTEMNGPVLKILKFLKRLFNQKSNKRRNMYNLKRRRESVASVYRKTTKFLSSNTANFLKKAPNTKKYNLLARIVEEYQKNTDRDSKNSNEKDESDRISDLGERDLDYYLGVREKVTYWRDPEGKEQIRKDYLLYHCGITEDDYEKNYKRTIAPNPTYHVHPKLKQVPFKIHKKQKKVNTFREGVAESWVEKKRIFKLFGNRRASDTTSDSYSECDSNEEAKYIDDIDYDKDENEEIIWNMTNNFNDLSTIDALNKLLGVRIKEVSEGRPCDNCPELCPGFISHPWSLDCEVGITSVKFTTQYPCPIVITHCQSRVDGEQTCHIQNMCLSLKQLEWAEICRRMIKTDKEDVHERKIQKFPSRERNFAVRRKNSNNNLRSHVNCQTCAKVALVENT